MAELKLKKSKSIKEINDLINANLSGGIVPVEKNIPEINCKGIYFWYLESKKGYKNLSKFENIGPVDNCLSRIIDGVKFDLVYIGTAGVLKKKKSNLTVRLKWHIKQVHRESSFSGKNPALSTLRLAIGSLLSNDLIIGNTEKKVNDFIKDNMRVFWIEYTDNKNLIDSDEKILIEVVKPLINIKHNSNALKKAASNPTKKYRERRLEVIEATKAKVEGKDKTVSKTGKAKKSGGKVPSKKPTANIESKAQKNPKDSNKCVSFNVKQNESVAEIAARTIGLPIGPLTIEVKDVRTGQNLFVKNNGNPLRKTQLSVETFFRNPSPNIPKWQVLQNEMMEKNVFQVRLIVCPVK
jgi:hypothetical protein